MRKREKAKETSKETSKEKRRKGRAGIEIKVMVLVLLMAVTAMVSIYFLVNTLESVIQISDDIVANQVTEEEKISELSREFTYINSQVLTHVMTTNSVTMEELKSDIESEMAELAGQFQEFQEILSDQDTRKTAFDSAMQEYGKYKKTVESLLNTSAENKTQAYVSATSNLPMFNQKIEGYMDEMLEATVAQMQDGQIRMKETVENIPRVISAAGISLIAATVIILIFIKLLISHPIKKATGQVDELVDNIKDNKGDLTKRISVKSKDEIGRLALAINDLMSQMQTIIASLVSGCGRITEKQEHIAGNLDTINRIAENSSDSLTQLTAGMEKVAGAVLGAKDDTLAVETAVDDMLRTARDGSSYAASIKDKARIMEEKATGSKREATSVIGEIDGAVQKSIKDSEQIHKITELTDEILGIANTTNLLALNASIEAARAGEAGKGFAVVADEIRQLADHSRASANNIQEISKRVVGTVEELADNATRLLSYVNSRVMADYDTLESTGKDYFEAAENVDDMMKNFQLAIDHLLESVKNVNQANSMIDDTVMESTGQVDKVVINNSEMEEELRSISAAVGDMESVVEQLKKSVECFQKI